MNKRFFVIVLAIFLSQNLFAQDTTLSFKPFCMSAGIGIPYGGYGLNIEICPIEYCGINFGIGAQSGSNSIENSIGYAFGFRVYVLGQQSIVRPFLVINYGTVAQSQKRIIYYNNGYYDASGVFEGPKTVEGTAISLGVRIYNFDLGVTLKREFKLPDNADEVKYPIPLNNFLLAVAFSF